MYKKIEIGNLVTLRQGFAINKKTNHHMSEEPTQLHLLRIGDMKDGKFSIFVKDTIPEKFIAKEDDIIYTRTGQVGLVFRKQHGVVHNNCFTVTSNDLNILQQEFLFYALQEKSFYEEAISRATGAAQPDLPHGAFNSIQIFLPPIESQKKISNILNTYDNLIENNQKQIKLLEEAAQRLYKEWFVDLRFPGHENTKIIDGIPEGWSKGTLGDIAINTGNNEKKENRINYSYYLPIDCLPKKSLVYTESNDINMAKSSLVSFNPKDIIFGAMRPYFHKVVIAREKGLTRSTCFVINSKNDIYWSYLTMLLFSDNTINYATRISVGTTMPYVRWKNFVQMPILIPSVSICTKYKQFFSPIVDKLSELAEKMTKLKQARDLLLPKLISGELEV
jgi:type I restriction enzyme S subunit